MQPGTVLLFSVLLTVNSAHRYEELQRKYTEVTNKVDVLTEKLDTAIQSLKRYETIDRALKELCAQLSEGDHDKVKSGDEDADTSGEKTHLPNSQLSGGDNAGKNKDTPSFRFEEDVQVTFVEAAPDQEGHVYFVQYSAPAKAVVRAEVEFGGAVDSVGNMFADGHGNITVHSDADLMLTMFVPNRKRMLTRMFTKVNSVNESGQADVPSLSLSALPSEEAVFEKGSSVNVTVRYGYGSDGDEAARVAGQYTFYTVDRTKSNTLRVYVPGSTPSSVIVAETDKKGSSNPSDVIITINSHNNNCEGILLLRLQLRRQIRTSSFDLYLIKDLEIPVRMAEHTLPFPDGFLGFYAEHFSNTFPSDGLACVQHGSCTGFVVLVGNDPEHVTIRRKGGRQETAANHVSVMLQKSVYSVRMIFRLMRASLADRGTYVLQGTSRSGTVIEKDLLIEVRGRFFVMKKHSGVKTRTPEMLVVFCTVQGYPSPEIGFYDGPSGDQERHKFVEGQGVSIEGHKSIDTSFSKLTIRRPQEEVKNIYCQPETDIYSEDYLVYDADVEL